MSDSRREKIISAYWYDKRCTCAGWERIVVHHLWRLTTMGNKRSTHPRDPSKTRQMMPLLHWGSYNDLQSAAKPAPTLEPLLSPSSCALFLDHCIPDPLLTVSWTPQALSYLKDFAFALLSGMGSILQLSKRFLSSLLLTLTSKVKEACHDRLT